ncbi:putative mixed-linked glucanase protein [Phaeoacremonium minimum UCRPA7]|uniref:Putative mixed-linked glucanase protein n=1 Tax=Phaeoacremonium minimum (strain UCR-PA7) TaxID=1286976 RepID=R8BCG4_PHAM7|nr:putative mixed-linked glucanase protein [Phaeoacremonium minimum UCRPA7]EON96991.1 putative mixed-linked glucanase protein [Phaeoacremonium minimum UCRPA7]
MTFSAKLLAAALSYTASVASVNSYHLAESYDYTNFFEKFNFWESKFDTGNYNDVDPTSGFVNYRNELDAAALGLIATQGTEMFLGVNHRDIFNASDKGRDSVRLESKNSYNHGLFIADFTHFPKPTCGVWPAFWAYGDVWPNVGEIDIYEEWNTAESNAITLHTGNSTLNGTCTINQADMLDNVTTFNCDVYYSDENQGENQGCSTVEDLGQWGAAAGGIYAMEWTSKAVKIWSWSHVEAPMDIFAGEPNPDTWGLPHFSAGGSSCKLDDHLANQRLVLNIDFCGVTAGNPDIWGPQCAAATGYETCIDYVAHNPDVFADAFWRIKDIKVYERPDLPSNSTNTTAIYNRRAGYARL